MCGPAPSIVHESSGMLTPARKYCQIALRRAKYKEEYEAAKEEW
jgi:hypothetical protein